MVAKFTKRKFEANRSLFSLYSGDFFLSRMGNFKGKQTCQVAATGMKKAFILFTN